MGREITKQLAVRIAKKLRAKLLSTRGAHDLMGVFHNEILVATFGIRRGSEKDKGHDHVPKEIRVSTRFAKELGICTKSREEWIAEMIAQGHI